MKSGFGKLLSFERKGQKLQLHFEKEDVYLTVIRPDIIRVCVEYDRKDYPSKAIEKLQQQEVEYRAEQGEKGLTLRTEMLEVFVEDEGYTTFLTADGECLLEDYKGKRTEIPRVSWQSIEMLEAEGHDTSSLKSKPYAFEVIKRIHPGDDYYGLGDKSGFLNKKNYEYENWNSDLPQAHNEDFKALYKSIPILMCQKEKGAYGVFFDNTFRSKIDIGKESPEYFYYGAFGGNLDYYFIAGNDLKDIVGGYTYLTGTTPLPQMWTLGYHQSRWGYENRREIQTIADTYRKERIPLDVIHFDIDYMDRFKVFTWNEEAYGDGKELFASLRQQGVKPVTIVDPGTKAQPGYYVDDEGVEKGYFVKDSRGEVYVNAVWPGDSHFPDFGRKEVREWWADKHKMLTDMGVAGIWNDMNEPASFHGELPEDVVFYDEDYKTTHGEMHNVYGHLMSKATFEGIREQTGKRPFVITRACYAGTQKYAVVWTGDNQSLWSHLQMMIPQLCNLGLSGFAFAGTDIGGFGADCTPELLCRWIEAAMFSPLFRNHSAKGTRPQEPWQFGREAVEINRKYIELRYAFLPYLYDLFYQGEKTGLPVMRPLVLHYPKDPAVRNLNSQFMVGQQLIVAPVLEPGVTKRMVYLPEGLWYDFWTGEEVQGNSYILRDAPLDVCPMYVKAGSILPMYPVMQYVGEAPYDTLELVVAPGEGEYNHFQDNGEDYSYQQGAYNLYHFTTDKDGNVSASMIHEGYTKYGTIKVRRLGE